MLCGEEDQLMQILHERGYIYIRKVHDNTRCYTNAECILDIINRVKEVTISKKTFKKFRNCGDELAMYLSILSINDNGIGSYSQFRGFENLAIASYITETILNYMNLEKPIELVNGTIKFAENKKKIKSVYKLMTKQSKWYIFKNYKGIPNNVLDKKLTFTQKNILEQEEKFCLESDIERCR